MHLIVHCRQLLPIERVEVGGFALWVRGDARGKAWDVDVTRPILAGDEYELAPLVAAGHRIGTVLDVGAHVGAFTLKVKRLWPAARVIAVEPDPDSAALFRRNTEGLPGVAFHQAALLGAAAPTTVELRQTGRANADGNAAASCVTALLPAAERAGREPTAVVAALGVLELLARHGEPTVDLLKLDCEGAEAEILEALAAAGRMEGVRWVRGEWHHPANLPRLEAALAATHTAAFHRGSTPWGSFLAHRTVDAEQPGAAVPPTPQGAS